VQRCRQATAHLGQLVGGEEELGAVCAAALETVGHACEGGVYAVDLEKGEGECRRSRRVMGGGGGS
jgi:hypothetical protein